MGKETFEEKEMELLHNAVHVAETKLGTKIKISNDIINKVKGVNRVVYDISSKPPATIEWE